MGRQQWHDHRRHEQQCERGGCGYAIDREHSIILHGSRGTATPGVVLCPLCSRCYCPALVPRRGLASPPWIGTVYVSMAPTTTWRIEARRPCRMTAGKLSAPATSHPTRSKPMLIVSHASRSDGSVVWRGWSDGMWADLLNAIPCQPTSRRAARASCSGRGMSLARITRP